MLVELALISSLALARAVPGEAPETAAPAALAPAPAAPAAAGQTGTVVRRTIEMPWRCGGEVSIAQVEGVNAPIRRIRGVATVWSTNRDRLIVEPFLYVTGPSSAVPALSVVHFDVDDPGWLSLLEGRGMATFYGDRSDGANDATCSGARIFLWIELDD